MKIYKISDVKRFMSLFLNGTPFDDFELVESTIKKYTTVSIDGHVNESFYKNDETHTPYGGEYVLWSEIRPLCMELIKGRNTPLYMKFVLQKTPSALSDIPDAKSLAEARSLCLNLIFSEQGLNLTTGVNFTGFYPESSLPGLWDKYIEELLIKNGLKFDII